MKMHYIDPTFISLPHDGEDVKRFLTYRDRQIEFQISRMKKNVRYGRSEWAIQKIEELKGQVQRSLIWYDDKTGEPCTLAGLRDLLHQRFRWELEDLPYQASGRSFPYANAPKFKNREYQDEAVYALLNARHGAIELPTGAGKSAIIRDLAKHEPQQTLVLAPMAAVANQLFAQLSYMFGTKWVGMYGDGKKHLNKLITVGVAQSFVNMKEGTKEYEYFKNCKKIIFDESHMVAAETFESIMLGIMRDAPERYFLSATQLRTDGAEMLLKGITGPIVYRKSFKELRDAKYLAHPRIRIMKVPMYGQKSVLEPKEETRIQLYNNPNVLSLAANIANKMVESGKQVIILIEELRSFDVLKNHLRVDFRFIHGGATKDHKEWLPQEYWQSLDTTEETEKFNKGETRLIIGTSAIATGTDFIPVNCLINLQGGTSEIKVKQGIGRGTRVDPTTGKYDFFVVDFKVEGSAIMERHLNERVGIYEELSDDIQYA